MIEHCCRPWTTEIRSCSPTRTSAGWRGWCWTLRTSVGKTGWFIRKGSRRITARAVACFRWVKGPSLLTTRPCRVWPGRSAGCGTFPNRRACPTRWHPWRCSTWTAPTTFSSKATRTWESYRVRANDGRHCYFVCSSVMFLLPYHVIERRSQCYQSKAELILRYILLAYRIYLYVCVFVCYLFCFFSITFVTIAIFRAVRKIR